MEKPLLRLSSATLVVIANMIGAGVFTTTGFALADLGNPHYVMATWIIGGIIAICGAYSYGMLSSGIAESGGEYIFLAKNIHISAGFVAGMVSMTAGFSGAIAYAALSLESYINLPDSMSSGLIASLVIIFFGVLHSFMSKVTVSMQSLMVYGKVIALVIFIAVPYASFEPVNFFHYDTEFSIKTFATSVMWVMFSYSGFNAAVYMYEEVTNPEVNVPKAMLLGTIIVFILYVLLNGIFVYYPPLEQVIGKADIAAQTTKILYGSGATLVVAGIVCLCLITSVSSMMLIGPRVYIKMAQHGVLPRIFLTKTNAILMQASLALIIVWVATLRELLSYFSFTLTLSSMISISSLFWMDKKILPKYKYIFPLTYIVASLVFSSILAINKPLECFVGLLTITLGLVHYKLYKK